MHFSIYSLFLPLVCHLLAQAQVIDHAESPVLTPNFPTTNVMGHSLNIVTVMSTVTVNASCTNVSMTTLRPSATIVSTAAIPANASWITNSTIMLRPSTTIVSTAAVPVNVSWTSNSTNMPLPSSTITSVATVASNISSNTTSTAASRSLFTTVPALFTTIGITTVSPAPQQEVNINGSGNHVVQVGPVQSSPVNITEIEQHINETVINIDNTQVNLNITFPVTTLLVPTTLVKTATVEIATTIVAVSTVKSATTTVPISTVKLATTIVPVPTVKPATRPPGYPEPVNPNVTCAMVQAKLQDPADQWNFVQADKELGIFGNAWVNGGLVCGPCRGIPKNKCEEHFSSQNQSMPEGCDKNLREAARDSWINAVLIWFSRDNPRPEAVCRLDEKCFDPPACEQTHGPAAYLILLSLSHLFDTYQSIYTAASEARNNVALRNADLHKAISWNFVSVDKTLAKALDAGFLFFTSVISLIPPGGAAVAVALNGVFHTVPTIIDAFDEAKLQSDKDKAAQWYVLNHDLEVFATGLRVGMKHVIDELFHLGKTGKGGSHEVFMVNLLLNGLYSLPQNTDHAKIVADIDKSFTRSLILAAYERQEFRIFFAPSEKEKPPNYLYGDLTAWCNREHGHWEWATPLLKNKVDLRGQYCGSSIPNDVFSGSVFCRDTRCYRPIRVRPTGSACYMGPIPGATANVLDGKKYGGLTFEELLAPIFASSFSHSKSMKGQKPGPEVQRDIDHKSSSQPIWPICDYSEWAAHEAEDNRNAEPGIFDGIFTTRVLPHRPGRPPIVEGCWNIQEASCNPIGP